MLRSMLDKIRDSKTIEDTRKYEANKMQEAMTRFLLAAFSGSGEFGCWNYNVESWFYVV